ncbi:hypothetical protein JL720_8147 [Aureococcus anophagefferens]|nr:hypothetical protein JL720_8147 [Aureococcus anophagefferens]
MALRKAWLELPDEPAVGWRVVDVVAEDGAFASVRDGASSTRVDRSRLSDYDATYEDEALCSDVSRLASLHAAPLVSALARRFRARTTYTNVGDVLIAERRCAGAGTDATVSVTYEPTEQLRVVDALAKALYAALFGSFVAAANAALAAPLEEVRGSVASPLGERSPNGGSTPRKAGPREAFVGILDIYGFEIFAVNGLDQLLINYANEVLQRSFDDCLLKAEAKRYDDDAVPWDAVDLARCLGSTKVVDLVAAPPRGLLPLLDEQVKLGVRGADAAFLTQADKAHKDCDVYGKPRFDRDKQGGKRVRHAHLQRLLSRPFPTRDKFTVTHYAGAVTYDPAGFLLSNSDPLPVDVAAVLATSSKPRVAALLAPEPGARSGAKSLPQLRESTSRVFRGQMKSLEKTLAACAAPAHYVRCVRPNAAKSPDDFDARLVLGQLTAAGVMDLVKLRGRASGRVDAAAFVAEFGRGLDGDADAAFAAALARAPAAAASYAAAKRAEAAALDALDGDAARTRRRRRRRLELDGAEAPTVAAALASARLGPGATPEQPARVGRRGRRAAAAVAAAKADAARARRPAPRRRLPGRQDGRRHLGFTGALDAFRGEVYDVIDKSAKIATLVAAEFHRQKHARAFRACAARSRPFADFLETNELLVVAKAVRLRKKGLFSTTEVDATAVVSSRGAVRVVVMRAVVGDCDRGPRDGRVRGAAAGGCCAAGGHVLAGDPGDAPCLVAVDRLDGAKRPKPLRFVDDAEGATRVWRGVAGAVGAADFRCLAPLAILALARE